MPDETRSLRIRLAKRLAAGLAAALVLYAVLGVFALPGIVRGQLEKRLSALLLRPVAVREIAINPFTLVVTVRGLEVRDRGAGPALFAFDELLLDVQASSLWERGLVARELRLTGPRVQLRRTGEQAYNVSDIVEAWSKPAAGPPSEPFRFSVGNAQLSGGAIDFVDDVRAATHEVRNLALALPFVSNFPHVIDTFVTPSFDADVNGRHFAARGQSKPFSPSRETTLDFRFGDVDVPFYLRYAPAALPFAVPSGRLDAELKLTFRQPPGAPATVSLGGRVELRSLVVNDRAGSPVFGADAARAEISAFEWPARTLHISKVTLVRPDLRLGLDERRNLDLARLAPAAEPAGSATGPALVTDLDLLEIEGGRARFGDRSVRPAFAADLSAIALKLERFSTRKDSTARLAATCVSDAGERAELAMDLSLDPWLAEGTLSLARVPAQRYAAYYASGLNFDVAAVADVDARFRFSDPARAGAQTLGLALKGDGLRLRERGAEEDFFEAKRFGAERVDFDFGAGSLSMAGLSAESGRLRMRYLADGVLDVTRVGASAHPHEDDASGRPHEDGASAQHDDGGAGETTGGAGWTWEIASAALRDFALEFEDLQPRTPVRFSADRLALTVAGVSPEPGREATLTLQMRPADGESVRGAGSFTLEPLAGRLALTLRRLPLGPFEPYAAESIDAHVAGGAASGNVEVSWKPGAGDALAQTYRGDLTLSALDLADSQTEETLLNVGSLFLGGFEAGVNPSGFRAREIAVSDFYARLVVDADATLNLARVFRTAETAPAEETADGTAGGTAGGTGGGAETTNVAVDAITLQGGAIDFADHYVRPNFSAKLADVGGRLTGLSAIENRPADVDLRAKLGGYAPLTITGKLLPLGPAVFVDISSRFNDVDLSPLSPYATKYLGYSIEKGRLTWDVTYNVQQKKLDAKHKILLDQLTLGPKVDSPTATSLPVRLAVSLLKDRYGRIDLELPVSGSIDDPKFRVWPIVLQILKNLLVKAATSPFALLGGSGGNADELRVVEYDAGQEDLDGTATERIAALAKLLADRPAVKLEITGYFDAETDREGLRRRAFLRKVQAQKLKDIVRSGAPAVAVDEVVVPAEEFPKYLAKAYKQEKFPKPRNALGIAKDLEPAEMEQLMLANTTVTDDDVRQLATLRATSVKEALVAAGVAPERLFLLDVKPAPAKEPGRKGSRVEFDLD